MAVAQPVRELRLALVLNGGVSLAVWMAGVAYEIDLLRRASAGQGASDPDDAVAQQWARLCSPDEGPHRRVVIDVIAGTSAGGINGTLLATAIARGTTLDPVSFEADTARARRWLREVWTERAALERGKLLPDSSEQRSILNGDYFTETIRSVLTQVDGNGAQGDPVTLFVTATSMGRSERSFLDSYGQPFTVADHRRLYQFENAPRRIVYHPPSPQAELDPAALDRCFRLSLRNDFAFGNAEQLARAARASASFPVAFAPVPDTPGLRGQQAAGSDDRDSSGPLLDGGILDNSPFGPVLRAVARQPLDSPADRLVLYVVPSNGGASTEDCETGPDPSLRRVIGATMSFPREADFRMDVETIADLMVASQAAWEEAQSLFTALLSDPAQRQEFSRMAGRLVPIYRRGRAAGGIGEAQSLAVPGPTTSLSAAPALDAAEIDAVLATSPRWVPPLPAGDAGVGDPASVQPWQWGLTAAERGLRLMLSKLRTDFDAAPSQRLRTAVTAVDEQLRRTLAVRDEMERRLAEFLPPRYAGAATVGVTVNTQLQQLRVPDVLGWVVQAAAREFADVYGLTPDAVLECVLTVEVVACSLNARVPIHRPAPFRLLRLGPDVAVPVLHDHEAGELARELGGLKLYGTQVNHFAAFGLPRWRDWDWLCGRLDAVTHLGAALNATPEWIKATQAAVLAAEGSSAAEFATRMTTMRGICAGQLHQEMLDDSQGGQSLFELGQRLVQLTAATAGDGSAPARWLRVLVEPDRPAGADTGGARLLRWLSHPVRANAWSRLASSHAVLSEPPRPRLLNLTTQLITVTAVIVLTLGAVWGVSRLADATPEGAWAAAAGVLVGVLAVLLAVAGAGYVTAAFLVSRRPARWQGVAGGTLAVCVAATGFAAWCLSAPVPGPQSAVAAAGSVVVCLALLMLGTAGGLHWVRRKLDRLTAPR